MKTLGIGGVFIRTKDINETKKWYQDILGISFEDWNGKCFIERDSETIFSLFSSSNEYFPLNQEVLINFQVDNINDIIDKCKARDVKIVRKPAENEYGKFVWIEDIEGRMIEIWEK